MVASVQASRRGSRNRGRAHVAGRAWDFDDLLAFGVRLLREHPHRLRCIRSRWRWLLVDEFQDVNRAQAKLISLLAGEDGDLVLACANAHGIGGIRSAEPPGLRPESRVRWRIR